MNARTISQGNDSGSPPRFDRKFIEDQRLVERYLQGQLPFKGARDLENWCRAHPELLSDLKLAERTHLSLRLLEASGQPQDLGEAQLPWWRTPYALIGLALAAFLSLVAFWALFGKYTVLRSELEDARTLQERGPLVQPATTSKLAIAPDRAPRIDRARIVVSRSVPQLIDLRLDMSYSKAAEFRLIVDKQDQGRALIIENMQKDSNNELRMTFNSTGLAAGIYTVRIEALPFRGSPIREGWLILEVR